MIIPKCSKCGRSLVLHFSDYIPTRPAPLNWWECPQCGREIEEATLTTTYTYTDNNDRKEITMCPYCQEGNGFNNLNTTETYSGVEIALAPTMQLIRVRVSSDYNKDKFESQDIISIHFCPMCGRKLD